MGILTAMWKSLADKGIGSIAAPWQIERVGKARTEVRRQELLQLAQTQIDIERMNRGEAKLLANGDLIQLTTTPTEIILTDDIAGRIEPTLSLKAMEAKAHRNQTSEQVIKEINLNKTIVLAEEELLKSNAEPNNQTLHDDWLYKWKHYAETVSDTSFQLLWAKILAGEVISPGSFSPRTLHLLHNFSQAEAEDVVMLAQYVIGNSIYKVGTANAAIPFNTLLHFEDIGIVSSVAAAIEQQINNIESGRFGTNLRHGKEIIVIEHIDPSRVLTLPCYRITQIGQELLKLCECNPANGYLLEIGQHIKNIGFSVKHGLWTKKTETTVDITDVKQI